MRRELVGEEFPHSHFDIVFSSNMLEHLPDPVKSLRGIGQVLRDDGLIIHAMPSPFWKLTQVLLFVPDSLLRGIEVLTSPGGAERLVRKALFGLGLPAAAPIDKPRYEPQDFTSPTKSNGESSRGSRSRGLGRNPQGIRGAPEG